MNSMQPCSTATGEALGQYLLQNKLISENMLQAAQAEQQVTGDQFGKILVGNGFVTQAELIDAIHAVDITQLSGERALITRCPGELLLETKTIIFAETENRVYLASLSDEDHLRALLRPYYPIEDFVFMPANVDLLDEYLDHLERLVTGESTLLERMLRDALKGNVTDLHIEPRTKSYSVFSRFNGVRQHTHEGSLDEYWRLVSQIKDRSGIDIAERRVDQDGSFQVEHNGRMIDLRVATLPTSDGQKITIRLLDPDRVSPRLQSLGISRVHKWRAGISDADGICLVCGPTSSGKTSTLNATVREADRFGKAINTLEDPIEYRIPYVTQVNINPLVGLDFARGVRAFMRNDPEIIVCGEIRDIESAQNAIKASETGHLVIGTLHTGSIRGAIDRMRDIGVSVADMRLLIRSILVQRLIRVFCLACAGEGCSRCHNTGYGGRTVISEAEYFRTPEEVDRMFAGEVWWPTMIDDAIGKLSAGITSTDEVVRIFGEQGRIALRRAGYDVQELSLHG